MQKQCYTQSKNFNTTTLCIQIKTKIMNQIKAKANNPKQKCVILSNTRNSQTYLAFERQRLPIYVSIVYKTFKLNALNSTTDQRIELYLRSGSKLISELQVCILAKPMHQTFQPIPLRFNFTHEQTVSNSTTHTHIH